MTLLFFMWGFITVWNDILIPSFKESFTLNNFQVLLVQSAFFGAYGFGALVYYLISDTSGDPINRICYKNGVITGLLIMAAGSALFFLAAIQLSYPFFLLALFIVGLRLAMLQIAANPYVTILGPERTAPSRLNLSQAANSLGTAIGPPIGGWLIFSVCNHPSAHRMIEQFVVIIVTLLATVMSSSSIMAQWTVLGVGLFCSVMWSNIFSLAIEGLGPSKSQASLLVMAILSSAILPPLQGLFADRIGLQYLFVVPTAAFAYVVFYGLHDYRAGRHLDSWARETGLVAEPA